MVKRFKNLLLQNQRTNDLLGLYVAFHALSPCIEPVVICSTDHPRLTLTYFTVFGLLSFYVGKAVRKPFNGRNLQQMTRVTKGSCLYKTSDPMGLSAHTPGLYTS